MVGVFGNLECSVAGGLGDAAVRGDLEVGGVSGPATDALVLPIEHLGVCVARRQGHAAVGGRLEVGASGAIYTLVGANNLRITPTDRFTHTVVCRGLEV